MRNKNICIKLSQDELDRIDQRMAHCNMNNRSAYLRTMGIAGQIAIIQVPELQEILRLVSITSNNVNQIAKRANETEAVYEVDLDDIFAQWYEIQQLLRSVLTQLTASPWQ